MKRSWKHSRYHTFTQSFPTAGLICTASIPDPSESLDGFFRCSSTHRIEEQMKSKEVSGLPKSPSLRSCSKSVPAGESAVSPRVLGLRLSVKHLHPLAPCGEGTEVPELPKWSSCSGREGLKKGIFLLFGVTWLYRGIEGFFFYIVP